MEQIFEILFGFIAFVGGLAIAALVGVAGLAVWGIRRLVYAIKGEEYKPLFGSKKEREYEHQDIDDGATVDSIKRVLNRYAQANVVGKRAKAALIALDNEERKRSAFFAVLDKKFEKGSLSWDKFAVAANMSHDAILRNSASLANRIQVFDRAGYQKQELGHRSSTWREGKTVTPESQEKQIVLQEALDQMDGLIASNDQLLTELDKLTFELGKLTDADANADGDRIVEEIRTLIDETKYYSQEGY